MPESETNIMTFIQKNTLRQRGVKWSTESQLHVNKLKLRKAWMRIESHVGHVWFLPYISLWFYLI